MSRRATLIIALVLAATLGPAGSAGAAWRPTAATGAGGARAAALPAGPAPSATVTARSVAVSWPAPTGAPEPTGYTVERTLSGGGTTAAGGSCAGTVTGRSCTDTDLATGTYTYRVRATRAGWTGAAGAPSGSATIAAPSLSLGTTSFGPSGGPSAATLAGFAAGETVTFRLDAANGTVLSTSPAAVTTTASGAASGVALTLPASLSAGTHTIHAIGATGTQAAATITVTAPVPAFTLGTSAFSTLPGSATSASLAGFRAGEAVTFRMDAPSGPVLTTSPATVTANASGAATGITIAIPGGLTSGAHTVYAIGAAGSQDADAFTMSGLGASPTSAALTNGTGITRYPDAGDRIVITFDRELRPSTLCAAWPSSSASRSTTGSVRLSTPTSGRNTIEVTAMTGCASFAFGGVDLGRTNLTSSTGTVATWGSSTIAWSVGARTVTITLGGTPTVTGGSLSRLSSGSTAAAAYTPDPALWALSGADVTGTVTTTAIVPF